MSPTQTARPVIRRKPSALGRKLESIVDQQTLVLQRERDLNQQQKGRCSPYSQKRGNGASLRPYETKQDSCERLRQTRR